MKKQITYSVNHVRSRQPDVYDLIKRKDLHHLYIEVGVECPEAKQKIMDAEIESLLWKGWSSGRIGRHLTGSLYNSSMTDRIRVIMNKHHNKEELPFFKALAITTQIVSIGNSIVALYKSDTTKYDVSERKVINISSMKKKLILFNTLYNSIIKLRVELKNYKDKLSDLPRYAEAIEKGEINEVWKPGLSILKNSYNDEIQVLSENLLELESKVHNIKTELKQILQTKDKLLTEYNELEKKLDEFCIKYPEVSCQKIFGASKIIEEMETHIKKFSVVLYDDIPNH